MNSTKRENAHVVRPALVSGTIIAYLFLIVIVKGIMWPELSWWWITLPIWITPTVYVLGMLLIAVQTFVFQVNDRLFGEINQQQYDSNTNEERR